LPVDLGPQHASHLRPEQVDNPESVGMSLFLGPVLDVSESLEVFHPVMEVGD